jgi:hypothetical protein
VQVHSLGSELVESLHGGLPGADIAPEVRHEVLSA